MDFTKCAVLMLTLAGFAAAGSNATMTIRILDQASVPASQIQKMEKYVAGTLASIQVDVVWIDCAADKAACRAARGANEFWLRILAQMPPKVNGGIDLLGFTQHGEKEAIPCINVFRPMVEQLAGRERTDAHVVLGAAVAHEIGHIYLGTNGQAHSKSGVMCGGWSHREFQQASIGELNFSREQGVQIRSAMSGAASETYINELAAPDGMRSSMMRLL